MWLTAPASAFCLSGTVNVIVTGPPDSVVATVVAVPVATFSDWVQWNATFDWLVRWFFWSNI